MPTTVVPSFTGSVSTSIQGININSYERYGRMSGLPLLGRSDTDIYYISSSDGVRIHSRDNRYFDETFRFSSPIGKGYGSGSIKQAQSNIGDDGFKIIPAPSFFMEKNLFGISKDFEDDTPFKELQKWDSVQYIIKQDTYQWPVVLDSPGALDPFDYNGVIEPLEIRKIVAGSSTFLDSIEDPEPHSVKGDMDSTDWVIGSRKRVFNINEYYSKNDLNCEPFEPVSDRIFDSNEPTIGVGDATYAGFAFYVMGVSGQPNDGKYLRVYTTPSAYTGLYFEDDEPADMTDKVDTSDSPSNSTLAQRIVTAINDANNSFRNVCEATLAGTGSLEDTVVVLRAFRPGKYSNGLQVTTNDDDWAKIVTSTKPLHNATVGIGLFAGAKGNSPVWRDDPLTGSADGGQWYSDFSLERFIKPLPYVTDHTSSLNPYRDRPGQEELFDDIRDPGIRSYLIGNSGAMTLGGRPNKDSESACTGFTFEHTEFGIDSIAFGGRKK